MINQLIDFIDFTCSRVVHDNKLDYDRCKLETNMVAKQAMDAGCLSDLIAACKAEIQKEHSFMNNHNHLIGELFTFVSLLVSFTVAAISVAKPFKSKMWISWVSVAILILTVVVLCLIDIVGTKRHNNLRDAYYTFVICELETAASEVALG